MSYLSDKVECKDCGHFFDVDQLNDQGICRDCVIDDEMVNEIASEQETE